MEGTETGGAHLRRWLARSGRRGPLGLVAAWRLFRAAEEGDALARECVGVIATSPGHRLREKAEPLVARWWVETRDPRLRGFVVDASAFPVGTRERLLTLALIDRLAAWDPSEAQHVAALLRDPEPDIRDRIAEACRTATGPMLNELWRNYCCETEGEALLDVLLDNPAPPPDLALVELWDRWWRSEHPDRRLGGMLQRWGRPASRGRGMLPSIIAVENRREVLVRPRLRTMLVDAMLRTGHPISEIAAEKFDALADPTLNDELCERALTVPEAARLCRERGLAPTDPVRRALYFVIMGQPEQQRALDPDGSLLSLGYASASDEVRARLREVLPTTGGLDLLRVIAGDDRRGRITAMSEEEILYLAEQLAARREWEDLWALAKDLPIATAVRVVRLFERWTPRHSDEDRLFQMMRAATPETIRSGLAQLRSADRLAVPHTAYKFDCRVNDVSFAPDGPFLAVGGITRVAGVIDLRTAQVVARYDEFDLPVGRVLHLGGDAVLGGEINPRVRPGCRLKHCSPSGVRPLHETPAWITSLAFTGENGNFVGATATAEVLLGRGDEPVTVRAVKEFGLGLRQWPRHVVVERDTGRLLLVGRSLHVLDPSSEDRSLTAWPGRTMARAAFADAGTVVCAHQDGTIIRMPLPDGRSDLAPPQPQAKVPRLTGLGVLPHSGLVVVTDGRGRLHLFAQTARLAGGGLEPAGVHGLPRGGDTKNGRPTCLTVSPNGDFVAVGYRSGTIDLLDLRAHEIAGIVDRPVVDLLPRHLGLAILASDDTSITGDARTALTLLRTCLEHRFRFDIEIGAAIRLKAGEYDISL